MHKASEIENSANCIMANLKLMGEAKSKCLIVEGKLDERLLSKYVCDDVYCCSVSVKRKSSDVFFSRNGETSEQDHESNKQTITTLINCVYNYPNLFNWPKGFMSIPVVGLVDKDFENFENYEKKAGIAATFTHDMETLLIATAGKSILTELTEYEISQETVDSAIALAYQLALLRKAIVEYNASERGANDRATAAQNILGKKTEETGEAPPLQQRWLRDGNRLVHYEEFCDGINLNAEKALNHLLDRQNDEMLNSVRNRIRNGVFKLLDHRFSKDGTFCSREQFDSFDSNNGCYDIINGHDIVSALVYLVPEIKAVYTSRGGKSFGMLETALIDRYLSDYFEYFSNNPTYRKLLLLNVVKGIN